MITLQIEHAITDYDTWRQAFDRFAEARRAGGVVRHRINHSIDDANYMVIELDFATAEAASKLREFLTNTVWAAPASAPALVGSPQTRILELLDAAG
jgi:hypothetical protein